MLDRISKTLDPVGRVQEYTYDPVGNVTEITKNGGRAYTYTYDNVGNLTSAKIHCYMLYKSYQHSLY